MQRPLSIPTLFNAVLYLVLWRWVTTMRKDSPRHRHRAMPKRAQRMMWKAMIPSPKHSSWQHLVDVKPAPALPRLERLDNRVVGGVEMPGGMLILRGVAAPDISTGSLCLPRRCFALSVGRTSMFFRLLPAHFLFTPARAAAWISSNTWTGWETIDA
jgi:hypothetical protein